MTDEVNLDNLDALADLPDSADTAVEADPVADAAVDSINDNAEEQPAAADDAVESDTAENDAEASGDADEQESEELDAGAKAVEEFSKSLRTLEGKWYVLHTYSGYEKRVKTNVESRVTSFGLEDKIFQIEVPMEEVDKHTDKGKKVITRVRIPGYVLIRMWPRRGCPSYRARDRRRDRLCRPDQGSGAAVPQGSRRHAGADDRLRSAQEGRR